MAIIKYRLMKDGGSGVFDTVHLETNSNMVLHGDTDVGQYLEALKTELAGKAASNHTHTLAALGAAAANHTHSQYLTAHQSLAGYVPTTRTVNGKALSANISLSAADVGAAASNHTHAYAATSHKHVAADITDLANVSGTKAAKGDFTVDIYSAQFTEWVTLDFPAVIAYLSILYKGNYISTIWCVRGETFTADSIGDNTSNIGLGLSADGRAIVAKNSIGTTYNASYVAIG